MTFIIHNSYNLKNNFVLSTEKKLNIIRVEETGICKSPSAAATIAKDGDIIEIDSGVYYNDVAVWRQNNLIIRGVGEGFVHLEANGVHAEGKAIWIIKGNNTTIENIEFSGAKVPDHNGAGIRQEGSGLILYHCYFHDNENGILAADNPLSNIRIEYSEFSYNGYGDGYTHNLYINQVKNFILRYCYIHHAKIGHNVKSRAKKNYILYNKIMDEDSGNSSCAIDIANGGNAYIMGNLIQQGPETENSTTFYYGADKLMYPENNVYIVNNTFVNNYNKGTFIRIAYSTQNAKIINNIFAGPGNVIIGPGELVSNLVSKNPGFKNEAEYNYHLLPDSPAIDSGSSPGSIKGIKLMPESEYVHVAKKKPRIIIRDIDIGAYESDE